MVARSAYDLVVPTIGRPGLARLLRVMDAELASPGAGEAPGRVVVVDDRPAPDAPLELPVLDHLPVEVVAAGGRGPAAGRNRGWRRTTAPWVCFLDDDVVIRPGWTAALGDDLAAAPADVAAVQGRVHVPLPTDRRPTDRERNVGGLATARWITADMAIRRDALDQVGGFDERFPRAYREDADLALRLLDRGWRLEKGRREIDHPVGRAPWTVSITSQRGNADDALMTRLHGPDWRDRADAPRGTLRRHVAATATGAAAVLAAAVGARRGAALLAAGWAAQWLRFTAARVRPGPRHIGEIAAMAATSAALPPAATAWALWGRRRARRVAPGGRTDRWHIRRPQAVLFDRDGTLVVDVPYNGDPSLVQPMPGARDALDRLRDAGIAVGMVSNQSGIARGLLTAAQVDAVNARIIELLGPFHTVQWCPHGPDDGCRCRKPATGMVDDAAEELGIPTTACAVVGDIGTDVEAAAAAGARGILVPTDVTLADEIATAPEVAADLGAAVEALLEGQRLPAGRRLTDDRTTPMQELAS